MKKHEILSPQARAALFNPPIDPAAIIRHYTFSPDDLAYAVNLDNVLYEVKPDRRTLHGE